MEVVMGGRAHGVLGGCTVFSISSSGCSHRCISRSIQISREEEIRIIIGIKDPFSISLPIHTQQWRPPPCICNNQH
jgi:hypothetical protein